ncbi:MAG: hypothetical protein AAF602_12705 [Myxococcota bacterium]
MNRPATESEAEIPPSNSIVDTGNTTEVADGIYRSFPFEIGRTWAYRNTDEAIPYELHVELEGEGDDDDGVDIYTLSYNEVCFGNDPDCLDSERFRIRWSSTPESGVKIHCVISPSGPTELFPPVTVAEPDGQPGDSVATTTAGRTVTSTFSRLEPCSTLEVKGFESCARFEITSDQPDDDLPFLGRFWVAPGNGAGNLDLADEKGVWQLIDFDCGTCDGVW